MFIAGDDLGEPGGEGDGEGLVLSFVLDGVLMSLPPPEPETGTVCLGLNAGEPKTVLRIEFMVGGEGWGDSWERI